MGRSLGYGPFRGTEPSIVGWQTLNKVQTSNRKLQSLNLSGFRVSAFGLRIGLRILG